MKVNIRKLCVAAAAAALYVTLVYATQSFAFGAYQIRIATALYSLTYLFPYLTLPLALANALSNLVGGLGWPDLVGGFAVGLITGGAIMLMGKRRLHPALIVPAIILGPGLIVPIWLSHLLNIPYWTLALNLCAGQTLPSLAG